MTYRGKVRNGVVVLDDQAALPEGTVVEVAPVCDAPNRFAPPPAFGIWRDREDMNDPADASRRIRRQLEERRSDG